MRNHTKIFWLPRFVQNYGILYKTLIGAEPLGIMFDRAGGFIRCYDATKLFGPEQYDGIYD